ncbi:hypothetical protein RISK_002746 [Rhodopirellula islandica]|uniref:Uncharacterized protein n=1 Tax=Rhodopirellula islandica TaxID=595434 RepID=A0A0J1BFC9_RHOIS|nr:hypothetical protein RISK_002746 [Rhodopirellula islandica]
MIESAERDRVRFVSGNRGLALDCEIFAIGTPTADAIFLPASAFLHPYRDENLREPLRSTTSIISRSRRTPKRLTWLCPIIPADLHHDADRFHSSEWEPDVGKISS